MTKDDLIRMADLAGYDVDDDDDVYAPSQGRYGLDPRLEHFAQLVAEHTLQYKCRNVSTKQQNVNTSEERVHESDKSIHDLRKAAEMALEALEDAETNNDGEARWDLHRAATEALRQALAQPEQDAVAWMWKDGTVTTDPDYADGTWTPLFAAPTSKPWVSLTAEEIYNCWQSAVDENGFTKRKVYDAIEAALRSKNNG